MTSSQSTNKVANKTLWSILIIVCIFTLISLGLRHSFSILAVPYVSLSGTSREWLGLTIALQNLLWGVLSPVFGGLIDKYGAYRVCLFGVCCYVLSLLSIAVIGKWSFMFGQILFGIGLSAAGLSIMVSVISKVAPASKRSLYAGIVTAMGSLGQFIIVLTSQYFYNNLGWQWTFICFAVIVLLLAPLLLHLKNIVQPISAKQSEAMLPILKKALLQRNYLLLTIGFFVCGFQVVFIATHISTFLADHQLDSSIAVWTLSLVGLFNIVGTLTFGFAATRYSKKWLLSALYLARAIVITGFLWLPITATSAIIFGILLGFLWLGTVPLTNGLVAHFFGTQYLTMLYGFVFFSHQLGSFMGAWLGGWIYDQYQNFDIVWNITILLGIIAAVIHIFINEKDNSIKLPNN